MSEIKRHGQSILPIYTCRCCIIVIQIFLQVQVKCTNHLFKNTEHLKCKIVADTKTFAYSCIIAGAPVKYTNWDPNRKDNENVHGQEDCVILKPNGLWDDTMCKGYLFSDHHHPWICQYRKFLLNVNLALVKHSITHIS